LNLPTCSSQAVASAKAVKSSDPTADSFALAKAYRLLGDVRRSLGDQAGAAAAWSGALAEIPANTAERPGEMAEHGLVLQRLGRQQDASSFNAKLRAMGYQRLS